MSNAIIFDFDGTLVDSKKNIYLCFQNVIKEIAPDRIDYAKNILIGPPLHEAATEILGPRHKGKLNQFIKLFIKIHDEQAILEIKAYPKVNETLFELHEKKIPMSIATNKRKFPTLKLIESLGWKKYFSVIECSDSKNKPRKKTNLIKDIINLNEEFTGGFFVGDTINDGVSANLNNLRFIKASYGYGFNQDWGVVQIEKEIDCLDELLKFNEYL